MITLSKSAAEGFMLCINRGKGIAALRRVFGGKKPQLESSKQPRTGA